MQKGPAIYYKTGRGSVKLTNFGIFVTEIDRSTNCKRNQALMYRGNVYGVRRQRGSQTVTNIFGSGDSCLDIDTAQVLGRQRRFG